jgi:hypothetical protein
VDATLDEFYHADPCFGGSHGLRTGGRGNGQAAGGVVRTGKNTGDKIAGATQHGKLALDRRSFPAADHVLREEDHLNMAQVPLLASVALRMDFPEQGLTRAKLAPWPI